MNFFIYDNVSALLPPHRPGRAGFVQKYKNEGGEGLLLLLLAAQLPTSPSLPPPAQSIFLVSQRGRGDGMGGEKRRRVPD